MGQQRILNLRRLCPSLCESDAGKEESCIDEWLSSDIEIKRRSKICVKLRNVNLNNNNLQNR